MTEKSLKRSSLRNSKLNTCKHFKWKRRTLTCNMESSIALKPTTAATAELGYQGYQLSCTLGFARHSSSPYIAHHLSSHDGEIRARLAQPPPHL